MTRVERMNTDFYSARQNKSVFISFYLSLIQLGIHIKSKSFRICLIGVIRVPICSNFNAFALAYLHFPVIIYSDTCRTNDRLGIGFFS